VDFSYTELRLFINPEDTEKYDVLKSVFFRLLGFDVKSILEKKGLENLSKLKSFEDKNFQFSETASSGFEDRKILFLNARVRGDKNSRTIFDSLLANIGGEQKENLLRTTNSRVDENLNYYLRLDIDSLLEGRYEVVDHGHCFHFTFSLITYPKDRIAAIEGITGIIAHLKDSE